jgi:hypothetical protein
MKNLIRLAVLLVVITFGATAKAESVYPLKSTSVGVIDEKTNLEWLDLRSTAGMTYQQVTDFLKPGGKFQGFQVASADQVVQLAQHGGIAHSTFYTTEDPIEIATVRNFMNQIGMLPDNELFQLGSLGRVSGCTNDWSGHAQCDGLAFLIGFRDELAISLLPVTANDNDYNYLTRLTGTFLHRSVLAVPEPETYGMLLAGLGLISFVTRHRSKKA